MNDQEKLIPICSPCYIYEESEIIAACSRLRDTLQGFDLLYSIKANPFLPVVRSVAGQGFGADAASLREVEISAACGIAPNDIYYSSPGKRESDIRGALGRCVLIADSLNELYLIQKIAEERGIMASTGLRIHPGFSFEGYPSGPSKFGIDLSLLEELKKTLRTCPNIHPVGLHVHLKSQILDAALIGTYYQNVMQMALRFAEDCGMELGFVNFGAGIGTVYNTENDAPVDLERLQKAAQEVSSMNTGVHARLLVETGRYVTCRAGRYITPVIDKKTSRGVTYLIVQNVMNGFLRPAVASLLEKTSHGAVLQGMEPLYTGSSEFQVRVLNDSTEQETVSVVGNLCTALDVIQETITLPRAEIGDLIEITNAGSYAFSLSPLLFSSHDLPRQYLHTADEQWICE